MCVPETSAASYLCPARGVPPRVCPTGGVSPEGVSP